MSPVRELDVGTVTEAVKDLCITANYDLPRDVYEALERAKKTEESPVGVEVLKQLLENADIAARDRVPICQDTGLAVFFVELGQDVNLVGGDLGAAIDEGVRRGYQEGYLRKSVVEEPAHARRNTKDNTPAIVHTTVVPGDRFKITMMAKGGGAENMSTLNMLKPAQGWAGMSQAVVDTVSRAGSNPCPPVVIGVGIGGTIEAVTLLAKKALLREIGSVHPDSRIAAMEAELLARINALGIGPQGLGGRTTCLAVFIEEMPCHIASMPMAVNVQCHAQRHKSVTL
ncbi:MAG TPA: fumarate hydratase [Thermoleophilia bacterium]|nr:fumarate hydratase [Thermoleophilia bacterium]HQG02997.1 fumarate hydratase [Thermoleophilia bacterium]HQG54323.1 fumarate hydratase [Thermoleophilia bacterium]HQJ98175.1 fumarate hydratase [Thermoleophilia bacterium]